MHGPRCIELADTARVARLSQAPNVQLIRRRRDGKVVEIQVQEYGDDSQQPAHHGNPRAYSHDHETDSNPARVWTLKHLPDEAGPIFRTVTTECLKRAA